MPYRVRQDGSIETDTAEEAVELAALLGRKKHGRRPNRDTDEDPTAPGGGKKVKTRHRGTPKTRGARRPSAAIEYRVKLGQVWRKRGGSSGGRVIQVDKLLKDGIVPKVIKDTPGVQRKGTMKRISYGTLRNAYKLVKDV